MSRRREFDEILLDNRSALAYGYTGTILILLALLGIVLFQPQGFKPVWEEVTVADCLSGLLAVGTLALATAALVSAVSTEKNRAAEEEDRRIRNRPHLAAELVARTARVTDMLLPWPNRSAQMDFREKYLVIESIGPGVARNVQVEVEVFSKDGAPVRPDRKTSRGYLSVGAHWEAVFPDRPNLIDQSLVLPDPTTNETDPQFMPWDLSILISYQDIDGSPGGELRVRLERSRREFEIWRPPERYDTFYSQHSAWKLVKREESIGPERLPEGPSMREAPNPASADTTRSRTENGR